jgi:CDP-diacylglycerol--glycerol-3-phosphate 3-phosphatidyltransferase
MANLITIARFPLLVLTIVLFYLQQPALVWGNIPLILLLILMDGLDGWIARRRNETSLLGSVLDIAADRTVELVLWVVFADLTLISIMVPLVFIIRGTTVDAVRSLGLKDQRSAFEQIQSPVGQFLVASRFMRGFYGGIKAASFMILSLDFAIQTSRGLQSSLVHAIALILTWGSVTVCLLRGIPALIEGISQIRQASNQA